MTSADKLYKRPESILVIVYTLTDKVLLLKRTDHDDFWQSVTGSMGWSENSPLATAQRELAEETDLKQGNKLIDLNKSYKYPVYPQWKHRYSPETNTNTEHSFALELATELGVTLNPEEHCEYAWLGFRQAADRVISWSNKEAILRVWMCMSRKR